MFMKINLIVMKIMKKNQRHEDKKIKSIQKKIKKQLEQREDTKNKYNTIYCMKIYHI